MRAEVISDVCMQSIHSRLYIHDYIYAIGWVGAACPNPTSVHDSVIIDLKKRFRHCWPDLRDHL